ncbi:MFS transporter [Trueperella bialowiezensis]|uniref:Enterobactin exporter EntS n=1 Tax=Trueperella bialowiezensis TaxID=312285 RepID=A0A3S4VTF7_9ACTO|nr:MFS transporter [Trueperella bialowiezensis]VEI13330.1 enterobactin exporter EntS [Trueperella bialowiezensis]
MNRAHTESDSQHPEQHSSQHSQHTNQNNSLWRQRGYPQWFTADTTFTLMGAIHGFVISLLVIAETGSAAQAGIVTSAGLLASGITSFFGGWYQDRFDRKKIAISHGLLGAFWYGLAIVLLITGNFTFVSAMILAIGLGIRSGLGGNVTDVMLRSFLPANILPKAISVGQARDAVVEFTGPPIAGFLLGVGKILPYTVNVALSLVGAIASYLLPDSVGKPAAAKAKNDVKPSDDATPNDEANADATTTKTPKARFTFDELIAGFKITFSMRFLRVLATSGNLAFAVFNAMITVCVWETVKIEGNAGFAGFVNTAVAIGVFVGAVAASKLTQKAHGGAIVVLAYALPLLSTVLMGAFDSTYGRIAALLPAMLLLPAGSAAMGSIQMLVVPDAKLGRMFSAIGVVELALSSAVFSAVGFLYEHLGYTTTIALGSAFMALCLAHIVSVRDIRQIPKAADYEEYAATITQ